jgi:hypothetical protein
VTNDRKLEVGGSMSEEATKDKMKLSSRTTEVTIKGSTVHDVGGMYTISAGKKYELTIGAMKKDQCAKDMTVAVTKPWTETTTGNMLLLAGENIMDGSDTITDWTVCNALDGTTQHLFVEAKDQIQLVVGASSITIDPDSVTIRSPLYDVTNAPDIIAKAPVDKHN